MFATHLLGFPLQDILCMPRVYCEKMKRRKHVIDQYPNTKKVAAWLVGRYQLTTIFQVVDANILGQKL